MPAVNLAVILALASTLAVVGLTWPGSPSFHPTTADPTLIEASVRSVNSCDTEDPGCSTVDIVPIEGDDAGLVFRLPDVPTEDLSVGDTVLVSLNASATPSRRYRFADQTRLPWLAAISLVFVLVLVLAGQLRGISALIGLLASGTIILMYTVPALFRGNQPILVGAATASLIAFSTIYLANGPGPISDVAVLAALTSIGLTGFLGWVSFLLVRFDGLTTASMVGLGPAVNTKGILLAGLMIGSLGALCHLSMTQSRMIFRSLERDPTLNSRRLASLVAAEGRQHTSAAISTLFMAYAGAAVPLLVLAMASGLSPDLAANSELLAIELIRALVGTTGLILVVPIATLVGVRVATSIRDSSTGTAPSIGRTTPSGVPSPGAPDLRPSVWERMRRGLDD